MPSSRSPRALQWLSGLFGRRGDAAEDDADKAARRSEGGAGSANTVTGRQLRQAHLELGELLDAHPDTRQLMRHLHYVERALTRHGSRALERVPSKVLVTALEQFERLVGQAPSEGLAAMKLHLQGSLLAKGVPIGRRRVVVDEDSLFGDPSAVDVSEATPSMFDETERSWTGVMPASLVAAHAAARQDAADSTSGAAPSTLPSVG